METRLLVVFVVKTNNYVEIFKSWLLPFVLNLIFYELLKKKNILL